MKTKTILVISLSFLLILSLQLLFNANSSDANNQPNEINESTDGGIIWSFDSTTSILKIEPNNNPESGFGPGVMKNYGLDTKPPWINYDATEVKIVDGVLNIGNYSFYWNNEIRTLTYSSYNISVIGESAFENGSLESIRLFSPLNTISKNAFKNCTNLTTLNGIESTSLTEIGNSAFEGCSKLQSISLPNSTESIGDFAFLNCAALKSITITEGSKNFHTIDGVLFKGTDTLFAFPAGKGGDYRVPDGVIAIYEKSFYNCKNVTSVNLNQVATMGKYSFYSCTALGSVNIGNITNISEYSFYDCTALKTINIGAVTKIEEYSFYNCEKLESIDIGKAANIGNYAFSHCGGITALVLPDNGLVLGNHVFEYCSKISGQVTIPGSLKEIPECTFSNCGQIQTIVFGDGVNKIGKQAFEYCSGIKGTMVFPASIIEIGEKAFYHCIGMDGGTLQFSSEKKNAGITIGSDAFSMGKENYTVTCRVESDYESGWLDNTKDGFTTFIYNEEPWPDPVTPKGPGNEWIIFFILGLGFIIFLFVALANRKDENDEEKKKKKAKKKSVTRRFPV